MCVIIGSCLQWISASGRGGNSRYATRILPCWAPSRAHEEDCSAFVVTVHLVSSCASSLLGKMKITVEGKLRVKVQRRLNRSFYSVVAEKHRAGLVVLDF